MYHFVSGDALDAILTSGTRSELGGIMDQRTDATLLFRMMAPNVASVLCGAERDRYAFYVNLLKYQHNMGITVCHDAEDLNKPVGFVPYYYLTISSWNEKLFAFYDKRAGAVSVAIVSDETLGRGMMAHCARIVPFKRFCSACGACPRAKLHKCARCKQARYCNRECQARHWAQHRRFCLCQEV